MNFNLVEMYNGLLRFNKHILNELAEGLKHLPNLDGASKGDSLIINEQGNPAWGSTAFIPTFENAAYGIEWTKDNNDIIRIGNVKFHRELPIQNRLKGCVYNEKKISYFLNPTGWAKSLENGLIPPLDGSDGDVGVRVPEFYICVKDTGTKYQLWISDFNIDGTFTRVHPFIISHTKTMTRTREDGKEEVFSACIKPDDTRYLGGNKSSSINAIKLQGRPRTGISYDKANEFCTNRGDWVTMIDYLEYCAIQALCYIEYANFDNQAALNVNLTSEGFKQGGLGAGVTNLAWDRWTAFNDNNPIYIMTKDELKDNVVITIFRLNSDISAKDKELLIKLFNSIIDYTNNTELEQDVKTITQKHNELTEIVNELKTKVETYSDKINELEQRVHQLENASQS